MKKCDSCGAVCIGLSVACPFCGGERICLSSERIAYDGEIILTDNADGERQCRLCEYFYREYGLQESYFAQRFSRGIYAVMQRLSRLTAAGRANFLKGRGVKRSFPPKKFKYIYYLII